MSCDYCLKGISAPIPLYAVGGASRAGPANHRVLREIIESMTSHLWLFSRCFTFSVFELGIYLDRIVLNRDS